MPGTEPRPSAEPSTEILYTVLRYLAAMLLLFYGFAKINGSQFTILDSELDKPMGQVSGFWLTWYYFGYSKIYGNLIAAVQIVGDMLLLFRRTTLLGACLLFPIIVNIILIDIFFRIDAGALLMALLIAAALSVILLLHGRELYELFWRRQNSLFPSSPARPAVLFGKWTVRLAMLVLAAALTYWIANYNNRRPTPIDGKWRVASIVPRPAAGSPVTVFFERTRAWMCVFKLADGTYERHHFEVDPRRRTIGIWEVWLRKGPQLFQGRYELVGPRLILRGRHPDRRETVMWILERMP